MNFHVHVYKVEGLQELDIEATNVEDARREASKIAREKPTAWGKPDCTQISLTFEPDNALVKTIVIGDPHGCFEEVQEILRLAEYEKGDRVIAVGDLIHRGPLDLELVRYWRENGFESCMGNHEFWAAGKRQVPSDKVPPYHRRAHEGFTAEEWAWIAKLPLFIRLPEYGAAVIHAGAVPDVPLQCQSEKHLLHLQHTKPPHWPNFWPSEVCKGSGEEKFWTHFWKGPERLIFGHSCLSKPLVTEFAVGIDTGCVFGQALTAVVLPGWKIIQTPAKKPHSGRGKRIHAWPCHGDVEVFSG